MSRKPLFYSLALHNLIFHHLHQYFTVYSIHHRNHFIVSCHQHDQHHHKINALVVERSKEGAGAKQCNFCDGKEN